MENKETFNYTYSAKEQEEIKKIRENTSKRSKKRTKSAGFAVLMRQ